MLEHDFSALSRSLRSVSFNIEQNWSPLVCTAESVCFQTRGKRPITMIRVSPSIYTRAHMIRDSLMLEKAAATLRVRLIPLKTIGIFNAAIH